MKKLDFILILALLVVAVAGVCMLFSKTAWVSAKTGFLLGALLLYIPCFIVAAANVQGSKVRRARMFLYGGLILLILAAGSWHAFSVDMITPGITAAQTETLRYYQQIIILLCSAVGGSSIFHGVRLFNEGRNEG